MDIRIYLNEKEKPLVEIEGEEKPISLLELVLVPSFLKPEQIKQKFGDKCPNFIVDIVFDLDKKDHVETKNAIEKTIIAFERIYN